MDDHGPRDGSPRRAGRRGPAPDAPPTHPAPARRGGRAARRHHHRPRRAHDAAVAGDEPGRGRDPLPPGPVARRARHDPVRHHDRPRRAHRRCGRARADPPDRRAPGSGGRPPGRHYYRDRPAPRVCDDLCGRRTGAIARGPDLTSVESRPARRRAHDPGAARWFARQRVRAANCRRTGPRTRCPSATAARRVRAQSGRDRQPHHRLRRPGDCPAWRWRRSPTSSAWP